MATLRQNLPYDWYLKNGLSGEQYILWYNFTIYEDGKLTKSKWEVDLDNPSKGEFKSTFYGNFNVADLRKEKYNTSKISKIEYRRDGVLVTSIEGLNISTKVFIDYLYGVDVDSEGNPSYPGSIKGSSALIRRVFSGGDIIHGSNKSDRLSGYGGNDTIYGGSGDDIIHGGQVENSEHAVSDANSGNDTLYGDDGDDTIFGGDGDDKLIGDSGKDTLTGSTGVDRFIYRSIKDSKVGSVNSDVITDFKGTQGEKIDLSALDAFTGKAGNQAFVFIGSNAFTGTRGEVRFSGGVLQMNTGTDTTADMEIALTGVTSFSQNFLIL